jgi:hypothetical protein
MFIFPFNDIFRRQVENKSGEATKEPLSIEIRYLPAGAYTYELSINNSVFSGQIIKK